MQKIAGVVETEYIKVGDTVALKHRLPAGQVNIVSCSSPTGECVYKSNCIAGTADGEKFDESLSCSDDVFVVGVMDKSTGEQISHRDNIIFHTMTSASDVEQTAQSWMECEVNQSNTGGECSKRTCLSNELGNEEMSSSNTNECGEPFAFEVTKL